METNVYISGTGMTKFGKSEKSLLELIMEAVDQAIKTSDLQAEEISGIIVGTQDAAGFTGEGNIGSKVAAVYANKFGLKKLPSATEVSAASATGAAVLHEGYKHAAFNSLYGRDSNILLIGAEKMTHLPRELQTKLIARVIDEDGRLNGETMLGIAAEKVMPSYEKYGLTYGDLDKMAAKLHLRATKNPNARFFGKYPTDEEVWSALRDPQKNYVISGENYRMFHSTSTDDGAAAMIITNNPTNIEIIGIGQGNAPMRFEERDGCYGFEATMRAAEEAFAMAKLKPEDFFGNSLIEVHDAFLPYVFPQLAAMGFYSDLGSCIEAFRNGHHNEEGILPVNISGGLKGRGHPLGASSLAQVIEITKQMRHEAGKLQLNKDIIYGVSSAIGGFATTNYITIIENLSK